MNKAFLREFIECFKSQPALWQYKCEDYKKKKIRDKSWNKLLKKFQEFDEDADVDMVKRKVNSLRASYRRELQKIRRSEMSEADADDVYQPTLWYFEALNFLRDQEFILDDFNTFDDPLMVDIESPKIIKRKYDESNEYLQETVHHLETTVSKKPRDDADVFAEGWAVMFRQLSREQQIFAKRGIDELLIQGQLGILTYNTVPVCQLPI